jgi:hypothetical protein
MLIRRDALMAQPYAMVHDHDKLVSARQAPPTAGYAMNPMQQWEAMQKANHDRKKAELVRNASGEAGEAGESVAQKWLAV